MKKLYTITLNVQELSQNETRNTQGGMLSRMGRIFVREIKDPKTIADVTIRIYNGINQLPTPATPAPEPVSGCGNF